ncbi:hypothetical protein HMPREF9554_02685 [Treponema phagedenis F0421]|nr:hypothetical protein HMPREF9554_02685 [Treponema phagedenis F0421]
MRIPCRCTFKQQRCFKASTQNCKIEAFKLAGQLQKVYQVK